MSKLFVAGLALSLAQVVFAADYRVEQCGYAKNKKFEVVVRETGDKIGGRTNEKGCVVTTLRDNRGRPGNNIHIEVEGASKVSLTIPGGSGSSQQPQVNRPTQSSQPHVAAKPQVPAKPQVDLSKVRNQAENNGRCFANLVVKLYSPVENYMYNLRYGLSAGEAAYNLGDRIFFSKTNDFLNGKGQGAAHGQPEGESAGRSQAMSDANSNARAAIAGQFIANVGKKGQPVINTAAPQVNSSGLTRSVGVTPLSQRYESKAQEIANLVRSLRVQEDGIAIGYVDIYGDFVFNTFFTRDYKWETLGSFYRGERAWELFKRNRIGDRCENGVNYYENLDRYANDDEARRTFRNKFQSAYENVVDEKFYKAVTKRNESAWITGLTLGKQIAADHVRDLGYAAGYEESYRASSRQAYNSAYGSAYVEAAKDQEAKFKSNAVITSLSTSLVNNQGTVDGFGVGQPIFIRINEAVNAGMQNANAEVKVSGTGLVTGKSSTLNIPYQSKITNHQGTDPAALISTDVKPDDELQLVVNFMDQTQRMSVKITWENTVKSLIAVESKAQKDIMLKYVNYHLMKEYNDMSCSVGGTCAYAKAKKTTLMERLIAAKSQVRVSGQTVDPTILNALAADLKLAMGEKPSGFWHPYKSAKWLEFDEIIKEMKK